MCTDYWSQFKGWTKSFTGLEKILTVVEAALLIAFFASLFYFIDHILHCQYPDKISPHDTGTHPDWADAPDDTTVHETTSHEGTSVTCTHTTSKFTNSFDYNEATTEAFNGTIFDEGTSDAPAIDSETVDIDDDTEFNEEIEPEHDHVDYDEGVETENEADEASLEIPAANLPKNVTITAGDVNATREVAATTTRHACTWAPKRKPDVAETVQFIDLDKFYTDFVASLVFINDPDVTFHCILVAVSENSLLARGSCLFGLRGSVVTDYLILKLFPDDVRKHEIYDVTGLWYHPLISENAIENYNFAVVRTDSVIEMKTQRFPIIPMPLDIMSMYVGQKVILLGFVRFISTMKHQNPVKFRGHLIPESECAEPPPLKLFAVARANGTIKPPNIHKFHCIAFLHWAPKTLRNFSSVAPVFRGLKFIGFVNGWSRKNPVPFVSVAGVRDWIQDIIN